MKRKTTILVRCKCGKIFHVLAKYAGKKGSCPHCKRILRVPVSKENISTKTKICPSCGAYLAIEDKKCISCQTNFHTGEWEAAKNRPSKFFFLKGILVAYIFASSSLLILLLTKKSGLHPLPARPVENYYGELKEIRNLPEANRSQLLRKLQRLKKFSKENLPEIFRTSQILICRLQKKQKHLYNIEQYYRLKKKTKRNLNCFSAWMMWRVFLLKIHSSSCQDKNIEEKIRRHIREEEQKLKQSLHFYSGQLSQLVQERRFREISVRLTPELFERMLQSLPIIGVDRETKEAWKNMVELYRKVPSEDMERIPARSSNQYWQRKQFQKKLKKCLKNLNKWLAQRKYNSCQRSLEKLWDSLHAMEEVPPEDPDVAILRKKLKEIQSIRALFSIANEGARKTIQHRKIFILQNGEKISGIVANYALGTFEFVSKKKVALKKLSSQDIVKLALSRKKNANVYKYAGIFYLYEKRLKEASQIFIEALKYKPSEEIHQYLRSILQKK